MSRGSADKRLAMVPVRTRKCVIKDGKARITVPRCDSKAGKGLVRLFGKSESYRVNLDEYGTLVWELCDGVRSVKEIGRELRERKGETVEPVYQRLLQFLKSMEAHSLIKYKRP